MQSTGYNKIGYTAIVNSDPIEASQCWWAVSNWISLKKAKKCVIAVGGTHF